MTALENFELGTRNFEQRSHRWVSLLVPTDEACKNVVTKVNMVNTVIKLGCNFSTMKVMKTA